MNWGFCFKFGWCWGFFSRFCLLGCISFFSWFRSFFWCFSSWLWCFRFWDFYLFLDWNFFLWCFDGFRFFNFRGLGSRLRFFHLRCLWSFRFLLFWSFFWCFSSWLWCFRFWDFYLFLDWNFFLWCFDGFRFFNFMGLGSRLWFFLLWSFDWFWFLLFNNFSFWLNCLL